MLQFEVCGLLAHSLITKKRPDSVSLFYAGRWEKAAALVSGRDSAPSLPPGYEADP